MDLAGRKLTRGQARKKKKLFLPEAPQIITTRKSLVVARFGDPATWQISGERPQLGRGGHSPGGRGQRVATPFAAGTGNATGSSAGTGGGGGGGGGGGAPDWVSRWNTATGNTDSAIMDGGNWDSTSGSSSGNSDKMYVIANPGTLGFPATMTNLLRVTHNELVESRNLFLDSTRLSHTVGVGQYAYYRVYYHCGFPNNWPTGIYHHMQNGRNNLAWEFSINNTYTASAEVNFYPITTPESYPYIHFQTGNPTNGKALFATGKCYRREWRFTNIDGTYGTVTMQIFDESVSKTVPIFTDADFWATDSTTLNLSNSASHCRFAITNGADNTFGLTSCGNNGPDADAGRTGGAFEYYGAFAMKWSTNSNDWILNNGYP